MGKDLGTYHLRVELEDGRGWIETWHTGMDYAGGRDNFHAMEAQRNEPPWDTEADLFESMVWLYTEGNSSCDCNKQLAYSRAYGLPAKADAQCGDTMLLRRLTAIRPDGLPVCIWPRG